MFSLVLDGPPFADFVAAKLLPHFGVFYFAMDVKFLSFFQLEVDFIKKLNGQKCTTNLGINWQGKTRIWKNVIDRQLEKSYE